MISIIAAISKNNVIGNKNGLPWYLPADFKYFKEKTIGKTIILGFNTFKSIGEKPLPNRNHIILSTNSDLKSPENCFLAKSIDEALEIAKTLRKSQGESFGLESKLEDSDPSAGSGQELMICGGAMVYKQFLPLADRMYLTYIHQDFEGDTFFPEFNKDDWREVSREDYQPDEKNKYPYSFVILERKK